MPSFFNLTPLLTTLQVVAVAILTMVLIWYILQDFVFSKSVIRGVTRIIIIGFAAFIISAPQSALAVGRWVASTIGFG